VGIFKKPTLLKLIVLYVGAAIFGASIGILLALFPWQFWH